jgi:hypothetical protein
MLEAFAQELIARITMQPDRTVAILREAVTLLSGDGLGVVLRLAAQAALVAAPNGPLVEFARGDISEAVAVLDDAVATLERHPKAADALVRQALAYYFPQ